TIGLSASSTRPSMYCTIPDRAEMTDWASAAPAAKATSAERAEMRLIENSWSNHPPSHQPCQADDACRRCLPCFHANSRLMRVVKDGSFFERLLLCILMFLPIDICFQILPKRNSATLNKYVIET